MDTFDTKVVQRKERRTGRKQAKAALQDYLQTDYEHWVRLFSQYAFRKDVVDYLNNWELGYWRQWRKGRYSPSRRFINNSNRLFKQYFEKWGLYRLPEYEILCELRSAEPETNSVISPYLLDRWYQEDKKAHAERHQHEYTTRIYYPAYMTSIRPGPQSEQQYVEFLLDISIPVDQLLAFLEKAVRSWIWNTYGERARGKRHNVVFHCKVFNLLHVPPNGKKLTFADVALLLKKKPSTIRYAYFSACQILGLTDRNSKPVPIPECPDPKCRNAPDPDGLCKAHKVYISQ